MKDRITTDSLRLETSNDVTNIIPPADVISGPFPIAPKVSRRNVEVKELHPRLIVLIVFPLQFIPFSFSNNFLTKS